MESQSPSEGQGDERGSGAYQERHERSVRGMLIGTAVGDALGLAFEGMSAQRVRRALGESDLRHRMFFGHGLVSDDTEHACMTAQAWAQTNGDVTRFARELRRKMMWWFAMLPGGMGLATARACAKMWLGLSAERSGVSSAGNGPAMRAGVLGVLTPEADLRGAVRASTRLTHVDPRAEQGAMCIAHCAQVSARRGIVDAARLGKDLAAIAEDAELRENLMKALAASEAGKTPRDYAAMLGLEHGVTGFINHTVPACVFLWLRYRDDYAEAIRQAVGLGGDTDTVAAITGGLVGARVGAEGIPGEWIRGMIDWPRSIGWIENLAVSAAERGMGNARNPNGALVLARNLIFFIVVMAHGVCRLAPR